VDVQIALFHVVVPFLNALHFTEVRPGTPEAVLSVVVGVSWTDDGHNHRQGAPFYEPLFGRSTLHFTGTF